MATGVQLDGLAGVLRNTREPAHGRAMAAQRSRLNVAAAVCSAIVAGPFGLSAIVTTGFGTISIADPDSGAITLAFGSTTLGAGLLGRVSLGSGASCCGTGR